MKTHHSFLTQQNRTRLIGKTSLPVIALISGISGLTVTSTSYAEDGFNFNSILSNSTFSHTIERSTGSRDIPSITTRTEETDLGFGISAGYKHHIFDNLYLAGEVFYNDQDVETRNINNLLVTELSLNETYGVKAKLGVDVNDKFSVYGLIGQTTLDFDINNSYTFAPPVTSSSADVDEFTIGVGALYAINDNWGFTVEYSQLNDLSFAPIPEVAVPGQINPNEVDFSSLSFGLQYNF